MGKAILYDSTLCIGCRLCEGACAERWGLPYDDKIAAEEKLSAHKLTAVQTHGERFSRRLCMHCGDPACEWNKRLPIVKKCDMCYERQQAGLATACAEACPTGATISGERDALIAEARRRIAENPGQYYDRIYGIEEVGGTSVLFLSAVPFEELGLPAGLPREPLPLLTWRALSHVPDIVVVGTVLLGGVWWITHRREEVAAAEAPEKEKAA